MTVSYAITVCNEEKEIKQLLSFLMENTRVEDEICVLLDKPKANENIINELKSYGDVVRYKESAFPGDFSKWKNELTEMCTKDYIFQIDADEIPHENLIYALPFLLEENPIDVMLVPRVNTVEGLTQEHIRKWGWNISKLDTQINEKELDLDDPRDRDEYDLLKKYNLIIEETKIS